MPSEDDTVIRHALLPTLAGPLLVMATDRGLRHLRILNETHEYRPTLASLWPGERREDPARFRDLARQLGEYFGGLRPAIEMELDLLGTDFQVAVWRAVAAIPHGKLRTCRQLAALLARPRAARAVGQAIAQAPAPIVIPTHRVIGVSGDLMGFLGGNDLKARLLRLEGHTLDGRRRVAPPRLF